MPNTTELVDEIKTLQRRLESTNLPADLQETVALMIDRLARIVRYGEYSSEYEKTAHYLDWVVRLPWSKQSEDVLDLKTAKKILDDSHYGLEQVKERILEYLAVMRLVKDERSEGKTIRAPILCFVGLVGTGKTTIAMAIAKALGRKFVRVPLGGLGDPLDLRGQSRIRPDAEPGLIIKALSRADTRNPVILLDEIDRVSEQGRANVMGVLIELLDPEQNNSFRDHFIDYPFDLSSVLFVTTCNNTSNISTAVLDRLELIQMPSYSDEEKITIAKNYILPRTIVNSGLTDRGVVFDDDVWPLIVRPLGYDAGIRTLERTIEGICRKMAKMIVENKGRKLHMTRDNIKEFIPAW